MSVYLAIVYLVSGCLLLGVGAHRFVHASSQIARYYALPPSIAGVLLVGFGGSFPEMIVSMIAAFHGETSMAIGNAIGSNIVNIGGVLAISALITPLRVHRHCITRDFPILWAASLLTLGLMLNGVLSRLDGIILCFGWVLYVVSMMLLARKKTNQCLWNQSLSKSQAPIKIYLNMVWWVIALILLFLSSELLVQGSSALAHHWGMSELLIGLTVVALGTSLPEFATTVVAAIKHQHEIALGNVIGSNIFNLLAVMAMPALIAPASISHILLYRDFLVMFFFSLAGWAWALKGHLGRLAGSVFLVSFGLYYVLLITGF